jgi:hypothetical protein
MHVPSYDYICVLIQYLQVDQSLVVLLSICVLILLYMCPHTTACALILLCMCPHTISAGGPVAGGAAQHLQRVPYGQGRGAPTLA